MSARGKAKAKATPRSTTTAMSGASGADAEAACEHLNKQLQSYFKDDLNAGFDGSFTSADVAVIWADADLKKKGSVTVKPDLVKWMQRIGVQPNFGKTLISIMGVQGGAVSKGAFALFMQNKVSGAAPLLSPSAPKGRPKAKARGGARSSGAESGASPRDRKIMTGSRVNDDANPSPSGGESEALNHLNKLLAAGKDIEGAKSNLEMQLNVLKAERDEAVQKSSVMEQKLGDMMSGLTLITPQGGAGAQMGRKGSLGLTAAMSTLPSIGQGGTMGQMQMQQQPQAADQGGIPNPFQQMMQGSNSQQTAVPGEAPDRLELVKTLDELRKDLTVIKNELALEVQKRKDAEMENSTISTKLHDMERKLEFQKEQKEMYEMKSRELGSCLSVLQDELHTKVNAYEKQLELERRRIMNQHHMQQKIIRLEQILPKHLVIKAFAMDEDEEAGADGVQGTKGGVRSIGSTPS